MKSLIISFFAMMSIVGSSCAQDIKLPSPNNFILIFRMRTCVWALCLFVVARLSAQDFSVGAGSTVGIFVQKTDAPVAHTALQMLQGDVRTVLGAELKPVTRRDRAQVIVTLQDRDEKPLPREGFRIAVEGGRLVITASDAHGMAYGMLEVSRLMGVSPWEWWADCTPRKQERFSLDEGFRTEQSPAVAYRGIFINDEDWGLNPWATGLEPSALGDYPGRIVGAIGPKANERIFQLMLRLRQNYYWPAMHECTQPFFLTRGNREMAAKYGIYIGGSHCEPMACSAAAEWGIRGEGQYNYVTNAAAVRRFWQDRLNEVKKQEIVYTIGMRGVHDGAMEGVKTSAEKLKYLQQVIDDQRSMLSKTLKCDVSTVPQVFVPYKEVLEVYHNGLKVPEDVTLMWTDDNYGYIRYFPTAEERSRKGGNGLYYHISYWGRPHDYLWLATLSPYLMEQQLTEAYNRGIQQMWILNVGDIKPAEFGIELFSDLAWNGVAESTTRMKTTECLMNDFYEREFGKQFAPAVSSIMKKYYQLAWERKPEHLAGTRVEEKDKAYWNTVRPIEYWNRYDIIDRVAEYRALSDKVEALWQQIPEDRKDAFFQLVKYPVQACAQMNVKFLCPEMCDVAYDSIANLTEAYNNGFSNNGKWKDLMSAAPRKLQVFSRIKSEQVPNYPMSIQWKTITPSFAHSTFGKEVKGLGAEGGMLSVEKGVAYSFDFDTTAKDSVTLRVRLLPNLPVDGKKLTFSVCVDGGKSVSVNYETYDRSEEWKRNVLRNYAERTLSVPVNPELKGHSVTFKAETEGVLLHDIAIKH